jgi:hypothetical protein
MMIAAVVTTRHQQRRYDHPPSLGPPKGTRQGRFNYEKVTSPVFESPKRGIRRFSTSVRSYRKRETKAGSDSYTLKGGTIVMCYCTRWHDTMQAESKSDTKLGLQPSDPKLDTRTETFR